MTQWLIFMSIPLILMILDLGIFNSKDQEISLKKSLLLSLFYMLIALLFGLWILYHEGIQKMSDFYTGYFVEQSLSLDNLFVISLIFSYLSIPRKYQHRVLFWGILGVIILRGAMIGAGAVLISHFNWILLIFSVVLILAGFKMLLIKENKNQISENLLLKFLKKHYKISDKIHGNRFWIKQSHPTYAHRKSVYITPLFVALILIEAADLIFAFDSIPAIFVITADPFIVFSSNIFAILGLRSLYFALDILLQRFIYLQTVLALILIFMGCKFFIADKLGWEKFPSILSLGITIGLLISGICLSLWKTKYGYTKKT